MKNIKNQIIENYIMAYNSFDIDSMLIDLDKDIVFENTSNGKTNLTLNRLADFKKQAENAALFFTERQQKITNLEIDHGKVLVQIDYTTKLAEDLQNLEKGQKLNLKGKSIFHFNNENKIIKIQDIS